jgi:inositol phosphorylceramide mannosyltransferase catalytic subunit
VIPRTLHRIWLGGRPMPREFAGYGETWLAHSPGWSMRLWTEADDALAWMRNRAAYKRQPNWSGKSDVLRYELLLREGGVYVDTDFQCLAPWDHLLDGLGGFAASESPNVVSVGVIGFEPGHPLVRYAVEHLEEWDAAHSRAPQSERTGPGFFTAILKQYRRNGGPPLKVFGPELFYPYHFTEPERAGGPWPGAVAVHHWAKSWWEPEPHPAPAPPPSPPGPAARVSDRKRIPRCKYRSLKAVDRMPPGKNCGCVGLPVYDCAGPPGGRCLPRHEAEGFGFCAGCDHYVAL